MTTAALTLPSTTAMLLFRSILTQADILYTCLLTLPQQVTWLSRDWPSAVVSTCVGRRLHSPSFSVLKTTLMNVVALLSVISGVRLRLAQRGRA